MFANKASKKDKGNKSGQKGDKKGANRRTKCLQTLRQTPDKMRQIGQKKEAISDLASFFSELTFFHLCD